MPWLPMGALPALLATANQASTLGHRIADTVLQATPQSLSELHTDANKIRVLAMLVHCQWCPAAKLCQRGCHV